MARIKDLSKIQEKWTRVTPGRSQDYEEGIRDPKADWTTQTAAAEDRYKDGVQKAAARGAFGKGVKKAGTAAWQQRSLAVGPGRFSEGVAASGDKYTEGFAPYHQTIQSTTLPPRFPAGDPRNYDRSKTLGQALRKKKESL